MARMRTIPKAVEELRAKDAGSCLTVTALRRWVKRGDIPSTKIGKTFLINMDMLEKHLEGGDNAE